MEFYSAGDMIYLLSEGMLFEADFATGTFASMPERFCIINWQRNARKIGQATFRKRLGQFKRLNPMVKYIKFPFDP